jgi:hypothetical protein
MSKVDNTLNQTPPMALTQPNLQRVVHTAWATRNSRQPAWPMLLARPGLYQTFEEYCKTHISPEFEVIHMPCAALSTYDFVAMVPNIATGVLEEVANEALLRACDPNFVGAIYWDEVTQMGRDPQKPLAKILNEGRLGSKWHLSKNCIHVLAGNRVSDKSGAIELLAMLRSRLSTIPVEADKDAVVNYFLDTDYNPLFPAYIEAFPDAFTDDVDYNAGAFCSERSLEAVAIKWRVFDPNGNDNSALNLTEVASNLGVGRAREFMAFADMVDKMPAASEIQKHPDTAVVPVKRDEQCAVAVMLAVNTTVKTFANLATYMRRFPVTFQILYIKLMLKRDAGLDIRKMPEFVQWALTKEIRDAITDR